MGLTYNPQTQNLVAQLIMEGGQQRIEQQNKMMQVFGEAIQQHKQNTQDAAAADTTFGMLTGQMAKDGVPVDPDLLSKFGSSGLSAKKGIIGSLATSYATAQKSKMDAAQMQEMQARAVEYQALGKAREDQVAAASDEAGSMSRFAGDLDSRLSAVNTDPETGEPMSADADTAALFKQFSPVQRATIHSAATMGRTSPREAAALLKQVLPSIGMGGADATVKPGFTDIPGTGSTMATYGREAFVVPKTTDAPAEASAVPVNDKDGNLLGYNVPKGGKAGGYSFVKADQLNEEQKQNLVLNHQQQIVRLMTQAQNPLMGGQTNILQTINDQIGQHQKAVEKLTGKDKVNSPAAANYKSADEVKAAYKAGKLDKAAATQLLQNQFGMQ